ncbi:sap domain-containing protein [Diplodia corticola]|uniref:Sap domain-containing protein n=1 Tax=Diplodia corticola TaxID=236234 RepID=A0A1J9R8P2_9PEZI|nr:sap domain-containing protein [Diplodia corticola]OJD36944.1 sap domain-containing protein [Diplodia corticola]
MADYAKMKNAELEALLKQRSLPHTGKKADMVARLQEADKASGENAGADEPTATATATATAPPEDEIDWDDDTTDTKPAAAAASTEASATAIKAGGQGAVANPQAVPNQVPDVDPSKTEDLSVKAPEEAAAATDATADEAPTEPVVEKKDFTSGIKETTLDEELEKRKARAKKFGLPEDDEAAKLLERAQKFGTEAAASGPRGLNEALPERRPKRGRDAGDEGTRGNNKRRGGRGGRFQGRRGGGGGGERRGNEGAKSNAGGGSGTWMSSEDKARAEARKARFAGAPSAS